MASKPAKKPGFGSQLFDQLYSSKMADEVFKARAHEMLGQKEFKNTEAGKKAAEAYKKKVADTIKAQRAAYSKAPLSVDASYKDFTQGKGTPVSGNALKNTGALLYENARANPGMAALTGGLGAMNVAGLVDNDNIIGQLGGSVLGGLAGAKLFGLKPYGTINAALAGGALGGLFDVLRSKKEQEEQYQQQYY